MVSQKFRTLLHLLRNLKYIPGMQADLKEIQSELESMKNESGATDGTFSASQKCAKQLVDFGDFSLFVNPYDCLAKIYIQMGRDIAAGKPREEDTLTNRLLSVANESFDQIAYLEVGSNYGFELIPVSQFLKTLNPQAHIAAFDPGDATRYFIETLYHNNLQDVIAFQDIAISNVTGPVTLYTQDGFSEDNRIVNPNEKMKLSRITWAMRLDDYIAAKCPHADFFVTKIDTQGAEPEVFEGIGKYLDNSAVIAELTPWAIRTRYSVEDYLNNLLQTHYMFELGAHRDRIEPIESTNVNDYIKDIDGRPELWTDMLLLPRKHADYSEKVMSQLLETV